jgi:hypothetical protein
MNKQELIRELELSRGWASPIFILSYGRPQFYARNVIDQLSDDMKKWIYLVVREDHYWQYQEANPDLQIVYIPKDYPVFHIGSTRQFILEKALEWNLEYIWMWDDDAYDIGSIYLDEELNKTLALDPAEFPEATELSVRMLQRLFIEVCTEFPNVAIGARSSGKRDNDAPRQKWEKFCATDRFMINKRYQFWQVMGFNMKPIREKNIMMPLPLGDTIAEDTTYFGNVLLHRCDTVVIPTVFHHEKIEARRKSTLGNSKQKQARRALEEPLVKEFLGEYAEVFGAHTRYPNGDSMYCRYDMNRWCELTGAPQLVRKW